MNARVWVDLIGVAVWPITVLVLVLALRGPIGELLRAVGGRVTGVTIASISLTFASEVQPTWVGYQGADVRGLVPADRVSDSYFMTLRETLRSGDLADYFVVDLKTPGAHEWLTSRLYLFSWILSRTKTVRAVVFVETRAHVGRCFLGVAGVHDLMRDLENSEPWLRLARWQAETQLLVKPLPADPVDLDRWQRPIGISDDTPHPAVTPAGEPTPAQPQSPQSEPPTPPLDVEQAWSAVRTGASYLDPLSVASAFTSAIQWQQPVGVRGPGNGWLQLPAAPNQTSGQPRWEHTSWIDSRNLADGLAGTLDPDACATEDRDLAEREKAARIARSKGDFVAILTRSGRFDTLVDRHSLLESLGAAAAAKR